MASPTNPHNFPPLLSPSQWLTLYSLTSTILSPIPPAQIITLLSNPPSDLQQDHIRAIALDEATYTNPHFRSSLEAFLTNLPPRIVAKLGTVFSLLNSIPGCLLLTYSTTLFHLQPTATRERLLQSWLDPASTVVFPPIRAFAKNIVAVTLAVWSTGVPRDVLYGAMGYIPKSGLSTDSAVPEAEDRDKRGFYKFQFLEFSNIESEIECDIVIVGSGCGGAVAAKRLAEEGFKVVVVEKGTWYRTDQLPLEENRGIVELFENNMAWPSDDGSVVIVAGATFGGGGTVNWCASLQTQGFVREEWAKEHNLPFFLSNDFQACLDYVCERMGVTSDVDHNHRNTTLLEGARKLGYNAITVPQNTGAHLDGEDPAASRKHSDGYCCFGCGCRDKGEGRKMGATQTWLPDAAKAGAKFIQDFNVERILFADDTKKKAVGVEGIWGRRGGGQGTKIVIKAKKVVISGGTMNSPCILLKSGLTNPNIGKNLYIHPVSMLSAFFPEPTNPWSGSALTTAVTEFENLDGAGHGVKIETSIMPPAIWMRPLPFHSPLQLKSHILNYRNAGCFIAILKENDAGMVYCDSRTGRTRYRYTPSARDRALLLKGVVALAKILYIQGAAEIVPYTAGMPPFKRHPSEEELAAEAAEEEAMIGMPWDEGVDEVEEDFEDAGICDGRFRRWVGKLERFGLPLPQAGFISAHQMGTCKMGSEEKGSVVDQRGRVWGAEGLYVCDASVFPSASGVNPMITVMAISHHIAGGLVKELKREEGRR